MLQMSLHSFDHLANCKISPLVLSSNAQGLEAGTAIVSSTTNQPPTMNRYDNNTMYEIQLMNQKHAGTVKQLISFKNKYNAYNQVTKGILMPIEAVRDEKLNHQQDVGRRLNSIIRKYGQPLVLNEFRYDQTAEDAATQLADLSIEETDSELDQDLALKFAKRPRLQD